MKKRINRLALLCHPTRAFVPPLVQTILEWAGKAGIGVQLVADMAARMGRNELGVPRREIAGEVDLILVLGGDGTILESVRSFARHGIPIAGINLGHLGFLTLGNSADAISILEKLIAGKFRVENRMMLQAVVKRNDKTVFRGLALNDAVIIKETISRVIDVEVSISGNFICSYRGDGVIFSTPTGSTAYSLSAGGPIVPPWVSALLICPLNSHTLNARPVITSDQETIHARIHCTHSKIDLVFDGQEGFSLLDGDEVEVFRAKEIGRIVVFKARNFFQVLRKKMKWGK